MTISHDHVHRSRRRVLITVLMVAAAGAAVPALAALTASRDAAPAQLSISPATPVFAITNLVPGDTITRCLRARNEGDSAISVLDGAAVTGGLAPYLRITVERGTGVADDVTGTGQCTGFRSANAYAYGTQAGGVAPSALTPEYAASWAGHVDKSLRVTIALPLSAPLTAATKAGTITFAFKGAPIPTTTDPGQTPVPNLPGGVAPGTTGGFSKDGTFLTNKQIKKHLRIGKARLLKNGNVVVMMYLPAGGAIRAKVILAGNRYYAHTLLPVEWGPKVRVLLKRRTLGRDEVTKYRHNHRKLIARVTTRYRWAHGPHAYVQPQQKLRLDRPGR